MADSASESYGQSNTICNSFFNIPGFFVGFSSKGSSDSDSLRSPTSPLDFSFFSNINNPFSIRSPRSPSQSRHHKKWDCHKVGLGIVNLLASESKPTDEVLHSSERKSIIFGPQVKTDNLLRSNSLPRNYIFSLLSQTSNPHPALGKPDAMVESGGVPFEPKPLENLSPTGLSSNPNLSANALFEENKCNTITSSPVVIGRSSQIENSLDIKPNSLPVPIGSSRGYVGSLSAREIELSEDYTCIISHGPNPKTTHIFGDYVLKCHTNELSNFDEVETLGIEVPHEAKRPEGSTPTPYISDDFLSFCCACKKKLEKGDDIYMYRGEKAFCSFDCRSEEIFAQEETEKTCDDSSKSSPGSSYQEDIFLVGMPITM